MTMSRPTGHGHPNKADREEIQGCWKVALFVVRVIGIAWLVIMGMGLADLIAR